MIIIDIGNTKTMLGLFQDGKIRKTWKMATHKNMLADEYVAHFGTFLKQAGASWENLPVCIASVVPHITQQLRSHVSHRTDVHFVSHLSPVDFMIDLPSPQTLGPDLVAAAQGAILKISAPMIIVDAGTATTITVITSEKKFIGGAILPGMGISANALFSSASALAPIQLQLPSKPIGNNTHDAILSGICLGHASMIENMITRFENELQISCNVVVTGGAIEPLIPAMPKRFIHEPKLTLEGLVSIHQKVLKDIS
jgi:type III pantothenate kinase